MTETAETFPRSFRGSLAAPIWSALGGGYSGSGHIVADIFFIFGSLTVGCLIQLLRWPFIRKKPFAILAGDALVVKGRLYPFDNITSISLSEPRPVALSLHFQDPMRSTPRWLSKLGVKRAQIEVPLYDLEGDRQQFAETVRANWLRWKAST